MNLLPNYLLGVHGKVIISQLLSSKGNKKNMQVLKEYSFVTKVLINFELLNHPYVTYEDEYSWTHVREIPDSKLLVSLHHACLDSANITVFNLTKKGRAEMIYSFNEAFGCKFATLNHPNRFFPY